MFLQGKTMGGAWGQIEGDLKKKLNYNKPLNLITTLIPNGVKMFYFYLILTLIKGLAEYYVMFILWNYIIQFITQSTVT